ncbi:MAG TPA: DUF4239 domain-containing protein [Vicinamibacteria bacterium]|nr:DUF4239 domain-containing protein [Vicinamibacteria bacterium]
MPLAFGLFVGVLVSLETGRRIGRRRIKAGLAEASGGFGAVEGAIFGLMGLMIAFTFSGAATRFDDRRNLVTREANAIGTAWLRLDLVPADAQPKLRSLFRRYVDSRILTYKIFPESRPKAMAELDRSTRIQQEIWTAAVAACRDPAAAPGSCLLLMPALNDMIDITTTRIMATRLHPPAVIFAMLIALTLASALLAGHAMAVHPAWSGTHTLVMATVMAVTVYVILDLEYPRLGLIRVEAFDQLIVDVRKSLGEDSVP